MEYSDNIGETSDVQTAEQPSGLFLACSNPNPKRRRSRANLRIVWGKNPTKYYPIEQAEWLHMFKFYELQRKQRLQGKPQDHYIPPFPPDPERAA